MTAVDVCVLVAPARDGSPKRCRECREVLRWDTASRDRPQSWRTYLGLS